MPWAAAGDAVVHHRPDRGARVCHQCGEAVLHADMVVRSAGAPCIERIDRRQARVEQRFELLGRGRRQFGQRHALVGGEVDQELALAAGVVDRDQAAGADWMRLREQDEGGRELVHVAHALHAVTVEEGVIDGILARDRTRMGDREPRGELGATDLQRDDGMCFASALASAPRGLGLRGVSMNRPTTRVVGRSSAKSR